VILFLDRLPLSSWTDLTRTPPVRRWSVPLPVLLTEAGAPAPPPDAVPQRWAFDTGFTGDAFAWRGHLEGAGLDPDVEQAAPVRFGSSLGASALLPVRMADLWLVSNLPPFQGQPFRLALDPGIAFRNVRQRPDPEFHRPLVGIRTLLRAGLQVTIDFARATVSVWVPGPWYRNVFLWLRRMLTGHATVPLPWSRPAR
jgi:hypothetical protein